MIINRQPRQISRNPTNLVLQIELAQGSLPIAQCHTWPIQDKHGFQSIEKTQIRTTKFRIGY